MPDTGPRVWLLPDGSVVTSSTDPRIEYWIHVANGDGIGAANELPEAAVPLVALPEPVPVDWDDDGYLVRHREPFANFPSVLVPKDTTVAELRKHIDCLAAELSDQIAALELLELEGGSTESAAEAARRKVLQDLKPGVHLLQAFGSAGSSHWVVVTPEGRLLSRNKTGRWVDESRRYPLPEWSFTLLAEGDLSPVVTDA